MTKDMSVGKPAKVLMNFTIPLLLGNIFQQLYNMVDSIVVGNYEGFEALAAVGSSFSIVMLIYAVAIGLTNGFSVIVSQYYGAGKIEEMRRAVYTGFISLMGLSLILTAIGIIVTRPLLALMQCPPSVFELSAVYLYIIIGGLFFTFLYNVIAAILRALGDSKTPLYMLAVSSVLNIGLDIWFVASFGWGVAGVAIATIMAQAISAIACLFYTMKRVPELHFSRKRPGHFDKQMLKDTVNFSLPSAIQQSIFSVGMLFVQALVNGMGDTAMAAYTSAIKVDNLAVLPLLNISTAVSTFTAQNMGAAKPERVKKGFNAAMIFSAAFCLVITGVVFLFGPALIGMFLDSASNAAIIDMGTKYLEVSCIFYILFGAMQVSNGVLRGAGDMRAFLFCTLSNLGFRIAFSYLMAPTMHFAAMYWANPVAWFIAMVFSLIRYFSGKWKSKALVSRSNSQNAEDLNDDEVPFLPQGEDMVAPVSVDN